MSEKIEQLVAMRLATYFKQQTMTPALTELKTELATDLNEAANDKQATSGSAEAAVAAAFSDFGDIHDLIAQVNAENGSAANLHAHRVAIDDDSLMIDDGEMLKMDANGVSINHGAIKADASGLKLGKVIFNEDGINIEGRPGVRPNFGDPVQPLNLAGEYQDNLRLVNEQRFEIAALTTLSIAYRSARVKILPTVGADDEIIVREYMNHNNAAYYAQTNQAGSALSVAQGKVPFLIPLRVHVQIHVPAKFMGDLSVASRSGALLIAGLKNLGVVNLRVVSGSCRIGTVSARALSADIVSGSLQLDQLRVTEQLGMLVKSGRLRLADVQAGQFTATATSGSIQGTQLVGGGSWNAKSGAIKLSFDRLTGAINLDAKSGAIKLALPADASYRFELEAHSGRVVAPANAVKDHIADGYQAGQVGTTPKYQVKGRTTSGSIRLY
ncbi:hypothetical protein C5Z25_10700 [Lactobacillus sp. CBA3605]|uniref:DUF4097 family beta strand repeat-containing protein n=1 Tax=Lactobacillus sp. CBA3605 TaxID=2099788 RepID=UPI000CFAE5B7|nr:DUF4097 family beta strand repeat-containing protein [Lactobacillus sp. CBA3605]AVK62214.1 hypothetical protein C5Z25_10700 [Lactobacillus sp. CBA3605]